MPPTLGQRLRQAREARQLSPQDIAFQIKIPPARVKDLEEDSYTAFGSLTYARSFLKAYALFLNVDASEVLEHIQSPPLGGAGDYRYLTADLGTWVDSNESHHTMVAPRTSTRSSRSLIVAAILSSCVLIAGVGVLIANSSLFKSKPIPTEDAQTSPLVQRPRVSQDAPINKVDPVRPAQPTPPKALVVPDKNAPPPRAEVVQ